MVHRVGPTKALIDIRLIGDGPCVEMLAGELVDFLEEMHYEVIEISKVKPCTVPQEDLARVYVKAMRPVLVES